MISTNLYIIHKFFIILIFILDIKPKLTRKKTIGLLVDMAKVLQNLVKMGLICGKKLRLLGLAMLQYIHQHGCGKYKYYLTRQST